jgi:hypothetical protein
MGFSVYPISSVDAYPTDAEMFIDFVSSKNSKMSILGNFYTTYLFFVSVGYASTLDIGYQELFFLTLLKLFLQKGLIFNTKKIYMHKRKSVQKIKS